MMTQKKKGASDNKEPTEGRSCGLDGSGDRMRLVDIIIIHWRRGMCVLIEAANTMLEVQE